MCTCFLGYTLAGQVFGGDDNFSTNQAQAMKCKFGGQPDCMAGYSFSCAACSYPVAKVAKVVLFIDAIHPTAADVLSVVDINDGELECAGV